MLLVSFLYMAAMVTIILGIYAILRYRFPGTLPGRVATVLV